MRQWKVALLGSLVVVSGCVTETKKLNGEVVEEGPGIRGPTPVAQIETQVRKRIDRMKYESGTQLLRSIETVATCRELALRPIAEALKTEEAGVRGNLVYTLSLIGGSQAHGMIVRQTCDESPIVRYEAAAALLQFRDVSGIPILIGFLEDPDRRIRYKSIQALTGFTKDDMGFSFAAPEPERTAAVDRWKEWWRTRRSEIVYE